MRFKKGTTIFIYNLTKQCVSVCACLCVCVCVCGGIVAIIYLCMAFICMYYVYVCVTCV